MPVSGPGSKIPGVKDGETPVPTSFKKVRAGDRVVLLLKGSHSGRYTGKCESQGSGKMSLSGTMYYTEDQKTGNLKRNISKGDLDFVTEDVIRCWVIAEAKTSTPGQRIAARAAQSRKRKVDEESEDKDEDEEEEDEEDEEEEERESVTEIPEEEAKEEEKERKKKKPAKEKHTTKRRLPVPFFKEIKAEGSESASSPRTSKKGRKASTEDEERSAVQEEVRMGNVLEANGTTLPRLGQHVRQCLRGQPHAKTLLAAALQLMFECPNSILRGPLCIRSDYIVAQRKCMEPLRQAGGPQYEEYAGLYKLS